MDYKEEYEKLKERVIDKYDYWYNAYLEMDIKEHGRADFLIGDFDEFLYNLELCLKINEAVNDLIYIDSEDLLLKFIELKKITDKRILSNPQYDHSYANEFLFDIIEQGQIKKPIIRLNQNLKDKEIVLQNIHDFLYKESFVDCELKTFLSHFEPSNKWDIHIIWKSNIISLVGFINDLYSRNILPQTQRRSRNRLIINHFQNHNGNLKMSTIKTEGTNLYNTDRYEKMHNFVKSLKIDFIKR